MKKSILSAIVFATFNAWATAVTCQSGQDSRTLLVSDVETGCKLEYTKAGETKEIATQKVGRDHCEDVQNKIKTKLEGINFKCSGDAAAEAKAEPKAETKTETK